MVVIVGWGEVGAAAAAAAAAAVGEQTTHTPHTGLGSEQCVEHRGFKVDHVVTFLLEPAYVGVFYWNMSCVCFEKKQTCILFEE